MDSRTWVVGFDDQIGQADLVERSLALSGRLLKLNRSGSSTDDTRIFCVQTIRIRKKKINK